MKITCRKILAVVLSMIFVLSLVPTVASAKKCTKIDGVTIKNTVYLDVGETVTYNKASGADYIFGCTCGYCTADVGFTFKSSETSITFTGVSEGVAIVYIESCKTVDKDGSDVDETVSAGYYVFVVESGDYSHEEMGTITALKDTYAEARYKESGPVYLYADFNCSVGDGANYAEVYVYEGGDSWVYDNGELDTTTVGEAYGTYYVADAQGNVYSANFSTSVSYTWWQWIIRILLLGFLWY